MKKALFFFPHPDDELFVGGGFLYTLAHSYDWKVKVIYTTNGDYHAHEAEIRLKEAINSCSILGVNESDIIFLGYGNEWRGSQHLYNANNKLCESRAGKSETYALDSHPDYSFSVCGKHKQYYRNSYIDDLVNIISSEFADLMICVDFDRHPDHRALSLLFSESLCSVLKSNPTYRPLVLKKLAYENVMEGAKDYFLLPKKGELYPFESLKSTPLLKRSDIIRFTLPSECLTIRLTKNPLYLAAKCHKTQASRYHMISAINSDICYWQLPTNNYALTANIMVSSGNKEYINDLKIIDSSDITILDCDLNASTWIPDTSDYKKEIIFSWDNAVNIKKIIVYENNDCNEHISQLEISTAFNKRVVDSIAPDGSASIIDVDDILTSTLKLKILSGTQKAGITEVMLLGKDTSFESLKFPNCQKAIEKEGCTVVNSLISIFDMVYFYLSSIYQKIYMSDYKIMRDYPITIKYKKLIPYYRIIGQVLRFFR